MCEILFPVSSGGAPRPLTRRKRHDPSLNDNCRHADGLHLCHCPSGKPRRAGAVVAEVAGGDAAQGAAVGAAVGAVSGAVDKNDVEDRVEDRGKNGKHKD